jgi:hypothetical protein
MPLPLPALPPNCQASRRHRTSAAMLPPPLCCRAARRRRPAAALPPPPLHCHCHCCATAAIAVLPPPLPRCCRLRCRAAATAKLPPPPPPPRCHCRHCRHSNVAAANALPSPPPPRCCHAAAAADRCCFCFIVIGGQVVTEEDAAHRWDPEMRDCTLSAIFAIFVIFGLWYVVPRSHPRAVLAGEQFLPSLACGAFFSLSFVSLGLLGCGFSSFHIQSGCKYSPCNQPPLGLPSLSPSSSCNITS